MILRKRNVNPLTIIRIGMIAMAIAGISNMFLRRHMPVSENLADSIIGFFYGIAISTTLLGIWLRGRKRSTGSGNCA